MQLISMQRDQVEIDPRLVVVMIVLVMVLKSAFL